MKRWMLFALLWAGITCTSHAAVMVVSFSQLAGDQWQTDLVLVNDGTPEQITGFTVYFDESLFTDLSVASSPANWDSLVIQPDLALASPGFFDSLVIAPGSPLLLGQQQAGFSMLVRYAGSGIPPMLPFEIIDEDFNILFSGVTSPIPEPSISFFLAFGLLGVAWRYHYHRGTNPAELRFDPKRSNLFRSNPRLLSRGRWSLVADPMRGSSFGVSL